MREDSASFDRDFEVRASSSPGLRRDRRPGGCSFPYEIVCIRASIPAAAREVARRLRPSLECLVVLARPAQSQWPSIVTWRLALSRRSFASALERRRASLLRVNESKSKNAGWKSSRLTDGPGIPCGGAGGGGEERRARAGGRQVVGAGGFFAQPEARIAMKAQSSGPAQRRELHCFPPVFSFHDRRSSRSHPRQSGPSRRRATRPPVSSRRGGVLSRSVTSSAILPSRFGAGIMFR